MSVGETYCGGTKARDRWVWDALPASGLGAPPGKALPQPPRGARGQAVGWTRHGTRSIPRGAVAAFLLAAVLAPVASRAESLEDTLGRNETRVR